MANGVSGPVRRRWIIHLIAQPPVEEPEMPPGDKRVATFANLLHRTYGGDVESFGDAVEVRMPIVEEPAVHDPDEAAFYAQQLVADALSQAGLYGWEISPGEPVPDLIGVQEVLELFGISKQRLHELRRLPGRFPMPTLELATGPVWQRTAIDAFLVGRQRLVGRPANPCLGVLVLHHDGTKTCTSCTAAGRDVGGTIHLGPSRLCPSCPGCVPHRFGNA